LDRFQNVVLDEADRMVDMGFIHDIRHIFSRLPKQRQNICFSATMKKDVEALIHDFLTNPVTVSVVQRQTAANVEQEVIRVASAGQKMEVLVGLLKKPEFKRVLVFGRTKHGVEKISKTLHSVGFPVDSIHGDKSQSYRLRALRSFKEGKVKILVATDVAARGLDIDNVSHVINYDLPANYEDYVHRIGRTGRAAQKGNAISLVT
jgi:superfamily II DNA/RNA helicase